MSVDPLDAHYACVIDDEGTRWGELATPAQREDARSLLDPEAERFQMLLRPRGGSKTTDLAAVLAVVLAFQAKPSDRLYAFASDRDQARLLHDALASISRRTQGEQGPRGEPGGLSGVTRATAVFTAPGTSETERIVSCPLGTLVTGGGFFRAGKSNLDVYTSSPWSDTQWRVGVRNGSTTAEDFRVYAVCAEASPS